MSSKSIIKLLTFMSIVMSSFAYFYIIPGEMGKSLDHEGFCFYNDTQTLIKKGESKILSTCEEVTCGDDYTISISGCGSFSLYDPNCKKWERDYSKPYPECCNALKCVEHAKNKVKFVDENNLE